MSSSPITHVHNGLQYYEYIPPTLEELEVALFELDGVLNLFCDFFELNRSLINADCWAMNQCNIRVDQRKLYYKIYHGCENINELKHTALICYWIIKYKPLTIMSENGVVTRGINEVFCLYLVIAVIVQSRSQKGLPNLTPSAKMVNDLLYMLVNRNFSYNSIVTFVEGLAHV